MSKPGLQMSAILFLLLILLLYFLRTKRARTIFPPGPPPKPIVGNAFDIPVKTQWLKYLQLSEQLASAIIHFSVMNSHIFVLHKMEDITELLERRSVIYSSRPEIPVMKLMNTADLAPASPYGDSWKRQRRFLQEGFKKEVTPSYYEIVKEKVHVMLGQLLQNPTDFREHCKMLSVSVTMDVTFGYEVKAGWKHDPFVELAEFVTNEGAELVLPGHTLVNVFPLLQYVPAWFPWASTQQRATRIGQATIEHKDGPFEFVKRRMATGTAKDCVLARLLENRADRPEFDGTVDESYLKDAMASTYLAGVDAVWCALTIFIFTMALHPHQQRSAQEEIDRVIGPDRIPGFEDRASLPFVEALYREVSRWRPVNPLGFPHTAIEDDWYKGFYFPKDSIVIPNVWAITRDETVYPDAESFNPERFLTEDGNLNNDTISYMFGFGRRICPGRFLADSMLWLTVASILSMFNISKAHDEDGNEIDIDVNGFRDSFISHPLPFECSIVPRSPNAQTLVRQALDG